MLPTKENIETALELYHTKLPHWRFADEVIKTYVDEHKENKDLQHIAIKVILVNSFYYSGLRYPIEMIYHIKKEAVEHSLDHKILNGDLSAVDLIKDIEILGKKIRYLSFASKYCHFHNPQKYPIFDTYARIMVEKINNEEKLLNGMDSKLIKSDYTIFYQAILALQEKANLQYYNFDQIDKYLWLGGQKIPSNKDNRSKEVKDCFINNEDLVNKLGV